MAVVVSLTGDLTADDFERPGGEETREAFADAVASLLSGVESGDVAHLRAVTVNDAARRARKRRQLLRGVEISFDLFVSRGNTEYSSPRSLVQGVDATLSECVEDGSFTAAVRDAGEDADVDALVSATVVGVTTASIVAFRRRDDDQVVSFLDDDELNEFLRYFVLAGEGDPIAVCVVVALCIGFCCFCGACAFCEVRTGAWRATARAICRLRAWLRRRDGTALKAVPRGGNGGAGSDDEHDDHADGGELVQQTVQLAAITIGADDDDKGGGGRRDDGGAAATAPASAVLAPTHRVKHAYQPSPAAAWQLPCTQGTLLVLRESDGDWSEVVLARFPMIGGAVPTSYLEPVSPDDGGSGEGGDADAPAAAAATTPPSTADDHPNAAGGGGGENGGEPASSRQPPPLADGTSEPLMAAGGDDEPDATSGDVSGQGAHGAAAAPILSTSAGDDGSGGSGGAVDATPPDDGFPPLMASEYDRYIALFREHDTDADGFVDGATAVPLFKKVRVESRTLFSYHASADRDRPSLIRAFVCLHSRALSAPRCAPSGRSPTLTAITG